MKTKDIENYLEEKIENITDFVYYWRNHCHIEYRWETDDGDEHLMVWLDFCTLKSFTKLFGYDTFEECYDDFECILKYDCIVFPHFERILEHCDIEEEDIKKIFPI